MATPVHFILTVYARMRFACRLDDLAWAFSSVVMWGQTSKAIPNKHHDIQHFPSVAKAVEELLDIQIFRNSGICVSDITYSDATVTWSPERRGTSFGIVDPAGSESTSGFFSWVVKHTSSIAHIQYFVIIPTLWTFEHELISNSEQ